VGHGHDHHDFRVARRLGQRRAHVLNREVRPAGGDMGPGAQFERAYVFWVLRERRGEQRVPPRGVLPGLQHLRELDLDVANRVGGLGPLQERAQRCDRLSFASFGEVEPGAGALEG
jgi:hypothetical protein